jgi:hypothetical protein
MQQVEDSLGSVHVLILQDRQVGICGRLKSLYRRMCIDTTTARLLANRELKSQPVLSFFASTIPRCIRVCGSAFCHLRVLDYRNSVYILRLSTKSS